MFSKSDPSPRHREMMELYRQLHRDGERRLGLTPEETYPGVSLFPHVRRIKELIDNTGARTILDYGCGKGMQYEPHQLRVPGAGVWEGVLDYWDIDEAYCYDPCYERFSKLPTGKCDGVVSTDVLEHCVADDVGWIISEMFSLANRFVFASVAGYPAKSTLPNGENAHCTVRPPSWWRAAFCKAAEGYPEVTWVLVVEQHKSVEGGEAFARAKG